MEALGEPLRHGFAVAPPSRAVSDKAATARLRSIMNYRVINPLPDSIKTTNRKIINE